MEHAHSAFVFKMATHVPIRVHPCWRVVSFYFLIIICFVSGARLPLKSDDHINNLELANREENRPQSNNEKVDQKAPQLPRVLVGNVGVPRDQLAQEGGRAGHVLPKFQPVVDDAAPMRKRQNVPFKLSETDECGADVKRICSASLHGNDFALMDCLQNGPLDGVVVSTECQNFVWSYKRNLTHDSRLQSAAAQVCRETLNRDTDCGREREEMVIPCLIDSMDNRTDASCKQFLHKMESIVFSDYRLVYKFVEHCSKDIKELKCGRTESQDNKILGHDQGLTIACLAGQLSKLDIECQHQILRVAELQADDYHQDRRLYYACQNDREVLCAEVTAGGGRVYDCLYKNKFNRDMSQLCKERLTIRQQMIAQDVKADHTFFSACHADVKRYHCLHNSPHPQEAKQSAILLCLESAVKGDKPVSPECMEEMQALRQSLMEDYKISPDIVANCGDEISAHCGGGLEREGKTLECLMELAGPMMNHARGLGIQKMPLGNGCKAALKDLLGVVDVGSDYRMDKPLVRACREIIETCRETDDSSMLDCLMDKIDTASMTPKCEQHLLAIQYFISRDFRLDAKLYTECHKDAVQHCNAPNDWHDESMNPDQGPLIFACLFRTGRNSRTEIKKSCKQEVKRVMHQRAYSVDLEPQIESECLNDLARKCSDVEKGEEIQCLQDNFEYLSQPCQEIIGYFTEYEDEDIMLDRILIKACTPMIEKYCKDEADNIMNCLIENKRRLNKKCASAVEHHQLISMKDYTFTYRFKEACKESVVEFCMGKRSKSDVITCLSEHVRNDMLLDQKNRIAKECRRQLKVELLHRGESFDLDESLKMACQSDYAKFCSDVQPGNAQVIECLKNNQNHLDKKCHRLIFKREREEMDDNSIDYTLMTTCKEMVKHYCRTYEANEVLTCLKMHKDEEDFDPKCRKVVVKREITQNRDYRLNQELKKECKLDIPKFCKEIIKAQANDEEFEGKVIHCLKQQYDQKRLSRNCEFQIKIIIRDAALDYRKDPVLESACRQEIQKFCSNEASMNEVEYSGSGRVEECLKQQFYQKKIENKACLVEVARILAEGRADIHVDPYLHNTCMKDLSRYCAGVQLGEGRQMACLLELYDNKSLRLTPPCHNMLKQRVEMWEYTAQVTGLVVPSASKQFHESVATKFIKRIFHLKFRTFFALFLG